MSTKMAPLLGFLILVAPALVYPATVMIPSGTKIFGELDERVTSSTRRFRVGYEVDGHVWKDVVVNGYTVIRAGSPMALRISKITSSSIGGAGGSLEIMAVSIEAVDGSEIFLDGGYDKSGSDLYGLNSALAYILWPSIFLPGRQAVLDEGTVFDATIPANTNVIIPDDRVPTLNLTQFSNLTVEILYDEIDQRQGALPFKITLCNQDWGERVTVSSVNENDIRPIRVTISRQWRDGPCHLATARVNLEDLTKHFSTGINRFTVSIGEARTSVVLNVEM